MTSSFSEANRRLAFALDYPTLEAARDGAARVADHVGVFKVGLELFARYGPEAVTSIVRPDAALFLDLKLHDIPATVQRAVRGVSQLGARYLTVHAAGGTAMLEAALGAAEGPLDIVAVTVLTSLSDADLNELGVDANAGQQVERLALLAYRAGVRCFVCSPHEAAALRAALGSDAVLITPGVRPAGSATGDQKRVMSPAEAIRAGADILVVGRPIRDAADPGAAARTICAQIAGAM